MAADFNPYHVWLGIPPEDQPADYYRLLSLKLFESNGDVIDSAADRQMSHLRTFQSGKHADLTQRLLNEVAAARVCLLDPKKRAAYDQQLRAKLAPAESPFPVPDAAPLVAGGSAILRQPPRRSGAFPQAPVAAPPVAPPAAPAAASAPATAVSAAEPQPDNQWDDLLGDPLANPAGAIKRSAAKRASSNRGVLAGITVAVVLIAAVGIGVFALNGSPADGTLVFDWPADQRKDAELIIDGSKQTVPIGSDNASFALIVASGRRVVRITRPGFKPFDQAIEMPAGTNQSLKPIWTPEQKASPSADLKPSAAVVATSPNKPTADIKFPLHQWVNVMRLVDTTRDRVNGTWTLQGTNLSCKSEFASRIELPVVIEGSYDFGVEFTRTSGNDLVAATLSVGSHKCIAGLSGWTGSVSGMMNVNGGEAIDPKNPIVVRPGSLENGRRYRLLSSVRILDNGRASVDVSLDGKPYLPHWEGDSAAVSEHWAWKMPHPNRVGLGANCEVIFHSARLRMVSGHASIDPTVLDPAKK